MSPRSVRTLRIGAAVAVVVALVVAWYLFRPELLFITRTVNEQLPAAPAATSGTPAGAVAAAPAVLAQGRFRGLAHDTQGAATIYRWPDGKRVLRLTEFETSNGPDVRVYLVAAEDTKDSQSVKQAGFLDLGSMKGNRGDQNYEVPADADLARYRSVSIWCARFSVNFGAAPLRSVPESSR